MTQALFIDEIWLKENSSISAGVDMASVFPFIRTAQDIYIQEAIGTSLYNYLLGIVASGNPISVEDDALLEIVRQALLWYAVYDFLPSNWVVIRNAGLLKQSVDNGSSVEIADMEYLRNDCKTKASFYINRLISYLCANGSLYAAYNEGCWSCGDIAPAHKKSSSVDLFFDSCTTETREIDMLRRAGLMK